MHCVAPASEADPGGQGKHVDAPGCGEYVPAEHSVWLLVPSHENPAGQSLQLVRVVSVPPDVNEPRGHTVQFGAVCSLHMLSAPHSVQSRAKAPDHLPDKHGEQSGEPPPANVPASQGVGMDEPVQKEPGGQAWHLPPKLLASKKVPAGQSSQRSAPRAYTNLPVGHRPQLSSQPMCNVGSVASSSLKRPGGQPVHSSLSEESEYRPIPQIEQVFHGLLWTEM